jgi:hypothetical protein
MDKLVAYHEAGHIVMSYIVGYTVEKSCIFSNGDGKTYVDYGSEVSQVVGAMTLNETYQMFETNEVSDDVCQKMVCILTAGGIAESIYKHGPDYVGRAEVEFSGPDMTKSENICNLKNFSFHELLSEYYEALKFEDAWDAIEKLSSGLLNKSNNALEKDEIELILKKSKFAKYL